MSTKLLKQLLLITLGTALMAFGIINFAVTNQMAEGGFTGITIILYHVFGLSTGISNLLLNIPMLIIGYRQFSKKGFWLTIFGTCMLSVFLSCKILSPKSVSTTSMFLSAKCFLSLISPNVFDLDLAIVLQLYSNSKSSRLSTRFK